MTKTHREISITDMTENTEPYTGRVGHLSPEQAETLNKLKEELVKQNLFDSARHTDQFLCRFLRARRFDLAKALKMLLDYEKWRKEFQVDDIVKTFEFTEYDKVHELYPRYYHGVDKEGRPVYIEHFGKLNVKKLMEVTTVDRVIKDYVYQYEKTYRSRMPACSTQAGKYIETSTTILDLKDVGLMQFKSVYSFVKQVSQISQNYYPESLGKMFIINAPFLFSSVWKLVTPMLDEVTVHKIHILGSDYEKKLLEQIDSSHLPVALGGSCACANGCDRSDKGPWNNNSS